MIAALGHSIAPSPSSTEGVGEELTESEGDGLGDELGDAVGEALPLGVAEGVDSGERLGEGLTGGSADADGEDVTGDVSDAAIEGDAEFVGSSIPTRGNADAVIVDGEGNGAWVALGSVLGDWAGDALGDDEGRESSSGDSSELGEGDAGTDRPVSVRLLTHGSGMRVGICHNSSA